MKVIRTAGIGLAAALVATGVGLTTGLPKTVAGTDGRSPTEAISERAVSAGQASRTAKRTIERRTGKSARVTGIYREDDYGARWEVEVTLRSGREFDVYVDRAGRVVKVVNKGFDR